MCFQVGDTIAATYSGKIYHGKISGTSDEGTYEITYTDGEVESNVSSYRIRKINIPKFKTGEKIVARYRNRAAWYQGKILAVNVENFDIEYDDGEEEYNVIGSNVCYVNSNLKLKEGFLTLS